MPHTAGHRFERQVEFSIAPEIVGGERRTAEEIDPQTLQAFENQFFLQGGDDDALQDRIDDLKKAEKELATAANEANALKSPSEEERKRSDDKIKKANELVQRRISKRDDRIEHVKEQDDFQTKLNTAFAESKGIGFDETTGGFFTSETVDPTETTLGKARERTGVTTDPRLSGFTDELLGQIDVQGARSSEILLEQAVATGQITQEQLTQIKEIQQQTGQSIDQIAESVLGPGGITQQLKSLGQQVAGAVQPAQDILQQLATGPGIQQALGQVGGFQDQLSAAISSTQNLQRDITSNAEQQITAFNEQSRFEEEQAITNLNDQLAARGLADSGAALEAISELQSRFSRQRNISSAQVRSQAQQQQVSQQLAATQQIGSLAQAGGQLGLAGGGLGLQEQQLRLGAAGQLGQLGLQATGQQADILGQQATTELATAGITQAGLAQEAQLVGIAGETARDQESLESQIALAEAGIPAGTTREKQDAVLRQQETERQAELREFQNLLGLSEAEFKPFAAALQSEQFQQKLQFARDEAKAGRKSSGLAGLGKLAGGLLEFGSSLLGKIGGGDGGDGGGGGGGGGGDISIFEDPEGGGGGGGGGIDQSVSSFDISGGQVGGIDQSVSSGDISGGQFLKKAAAPQVGGDDRVFTGLITDPERDKQIVEKFGVNVNQPTTGPRSNQSTLAGGF